MAQAIAASQGRRGYRLPLAAEIAATARPSPVGYLVNRKEGLTGAQGIGFDYVLGSGGLYVQSESAHLTGRVLAAPCEVRGLAPVTGKVELAHGPIPARLFELGLRWFLDDPDTERFFRRAVGRALLPAGGAPATGDGHDPGLRAARRGGRRVPLPRKLPRLLLEDPTTATSRGSTSTASQDASTATGPS